MKYAIIGDIHANYEALTAVVEKAASLGVSKFYCIGDIVGYNANPCECIELLRTLDVEVVVRGNHDEYACTDTDFAGFNPQAAWAAEWTRLQITPAHKDWLRSLPFQQVLGSKLTLVHATLDMPTKWGYVFDKWHAGASMNYQRTPLCFFGHTHVPIIFHKFGQVFVEEASSVVLEPAHKYMINAGSVGQPRDGNPRAAFAVYLPDERRVELHRVAYDVETCQKKVRQAGLPERLAARLSAGR